MDGDNNMIIKISDFRGISSVEVELNKILLIVGRNFHGKTSFAQAIGAVLTGDPKVYEDLTSKTIKKLIRYGCKNAIITVEDGDRTMKLVYPSLKLETSGDPFVSSRIAVGFDTVMGKKSKERAEFFSKFLGTEPTYEMLFDELTKGEVLENKIKEIWKDVEVIGWDGAYKKYTNIRRELKGKWAGIVEEPGVDIRYGIDVAENYLPAEWDPELNNKDRDELVDDWKTAEKAYEDCVSEIAVDESKIEVLEAKSGHIEAYSELYKKSVAAHGDMQKEVNDLKSKLHLVSDSSVYSCPKCKTNLHFKTNKLFVVDEDDKAKHDKMKKENLAVEAKIRAKSAKLNELLGTMQDDQYKLTGAEYAKEELQKIKKEEKTKTSGASKEELKKVYDRAKRRIEVYDMKENAYKVHQQVGKVNYVVKVLSEEGLRLKVLSEALKPAQVAIDVLCKASGWGTVVIGDNMAISYINKQNIEVPYQLCSNSERFRVDTILQMLVAVKEKSDVIIIDRADILDSISGLINLVNACRIPTVVLMTVPEKEDVPDLSKYNVTSVWMNDGRTEAIQGNDSKNN